MRVSPTLINANPQPAPMVLPPLPHLIALGAPELRPQTENQSQNQIQTVPEPTQSQSQNSQNHRNIMEGRVAVVMDLLLRTLRLAASSHAFAAAPPVSNLSVISSTNTSTSSTSSTPAPALIVPVPSLSSSTTSVVSVSSAASFSYVPQIQSSNAKPQQLLSFSPMVDSDSQNLPKAVAVSLMTQISSLATEHAVISSKYVAASNQYRALSSAPQGSAVFRDRQRLTQLQRQVKQLLLDMSVKKSHVDANLKLLSQELDDAEYAKFEETIRAQMDNQPQQLKQSDGRSSPFGSINLGRNGSLIGIPGASVFANGNANGNAFPLPGSVGYIPPTNVSRVSNSLFGSSLPMSTGLSTLIPETNNSLPAKEAILRVSPQSMSSAAVSPPLANISQGTIQLQKQSQQSQRQLTTQIDSETVLILRRLSILVASAFAAPVDPFGTHFLLHALILIRRFLFPAPTAAKNQSPLSDTLKQDPISLYLCALMLVECQLRDGQTSAVVWKKWFRHAINSHSNAEAMNMRIAGSLVNARRALAVALDHQILISTQEYDMFLKVFRGCLSAQNKRVFNAVTAANSGSSGVGGGGGGGSGSGLLQQQQQQLNLGSGEYCIGSGPNLLLDGPPPLQMIAVPGRMAAPVRNAVSFSGAMPVQRQQQHQGNSSIIFSSGAIIKSPPTGTPGIRILKSPLTTNMPTVATLVKSPLVNASGFDNSVVSAESTTANASISQLLIPQVKSPVIIKSSPVAEPASVFLQSILPGLPHQQRIQPQVKRNGPPGVPPVRRAVTSHSMFPQQLQSQQQQQNPFLMQRQQQKQIFVNMSTTTSQLFPQTRPQPPPESNVHLAVPTTTELLLLPSASSSGLYNGGISSSLFVQPPRDIFNLKRERVDDGEAVGLDGAVIGSVPEIKMHAPKRYAGDGGEM
ncbi:hypothetical protein HK100_008307 [Physocladia obscura]|uniref:Uncharacterized protein n=1 Tax=Physocladia obscura TaxID=109957 RepID=A0AAD5T461_9FUNG|nr:hypothetical protein HK100_008307 [Physocladia obscura]